VPETICVSEHLAKTKMKKESDRAFGLVHAQQAWQ
jgi:hypothetical protein